MRNETFVIRIAFRCRWDELGDRLSIDCDQIRLPRLDLEERSLRRLGRRPQFSPCQESHKAVRTTGGSFAIVMKVAKALDLRLRFESVG